MKAPTRKKTVAAAGASLALAATLVGVGFRYAPSAAQAQSAPANISHVFQAATPTPGPRRGGQFDPAQRQQFMQQRQQEQQAYLNSVASHLNISPDALAAAMKQARIDQINAAVAAGKLDQTRANQMIQAIQSGQGLMHPGGPDGGQRPGGERMGGAPFFAASVLGITPDQLRTEMQGGKTLAQVAQAHGISRDDLKSKLTAARKSRLDQAVQNGRLTGDQESQIMGQFTSNLDKIIDMVPGQGPRGPQGGPPPSPTGN